MLLCIPLTAEVFYPINFLNFFVSLRSVLWWSSNLSLPNKLWVEQWKIWWTSFKWADSGFLPCQTTEHQILGNTTLLTNCFHTFSSCIHEVSWSLLYAYDNILLFGVFLTNCCLFSKTDFQRIMASCFSILCNPSLVHKSVSQPSKFRIMELLICRLFSIVHTQRDLKFLWIC